MQTQTIKTESKEDVEVTLIKTEIERIIDDGDTPLHASPIRLIEEEKVSDLQGYEVETPLYHGTGEPPSHM